MVSPKVLLSTIETALLGASPPTPQQRIELMHAIRSSLPSLRNLLSYPTPKPSDRSQVQSKEVRLPDSPPISLDDQDVQIALKLSDDLNLNEVDCVGLLISANQEWGLAGREWLEILRLAAGLWYTERRDLITALYTLLRAVVLDQGLEADLVADIQNQLEDLFSSGLRQRLIMLIKELNREEPAGLGGPHAERYVLDSRGALVERRAVVSRERLSLSHCLVLSALTLRMMLNAYIVVLSVGSKDTKDVFALLKDCAAEVNDSGDILKLQVVAAGNDQNVEGFVNVVRFSWTVHLMLTQEAQTVRETVSGASSSDLANIHSYLEVASSENIFQFLLDKVLRTAAYQNDDEDMIYMYNAYLHKLMTCFLAHPLARDKDLETKLALMRFSQPSCDKFKQAYGLGGTLSIAFPYFLGKIITKKRVKEMKEKAMCTLSLYHTNGSHDSDMNLQQMTQVKSQPFVSLLELVSEIYQASSEEGASKVFELLQGKTFRSVGWNTLFECLSIYEQKFKQALQSTGTVLPEFQEGDAKALVAYLNVLQKVMENGKPTERNKWFPDIQPLFKLLSFENVPPYLKGALRNAIATVVQVSPVLKDTIWSYLEQYDLPVVVAPPIGTNSQQIATPKTGRKRSFQNCGKRRLEREETKNGRSFNSSETEVLIQIILLCSIGTQEWETGAFGKYHDTSEDFGRKREDPLYRERKEEKVETIDELGERNKTGERLKGVYDMRFELNEVEARSETYPSTISFLNLLNALIAEERDVSDRGRRILTIYDIKDEDIDGAFDHSQPSNTAHAVPLEMQLPILELLKDFMSGKTVFRNIMGILLPGVNALIQDRTSQIYGHLLEKAIRLSLEIIILVLEKDLLVADFWRPLYQLLLKSNAANSLIEDYAACLELRSEECQVIENTKDDIGILILQLLIDNVNRPAPNVAHLLLKFGLDTPVERTVLQPKYHYSCLKVILDILEKLSKPDVNALLHEFSFQLLYELCLDPLTCGPTMDLLSVRKYQFFLMHLDTIGVAPLPKRNNNQVLRISSLHQKIKLMNGGRGGAERAWLLKLLALELHAGSMDAPVHREACLNILSELFVNNVSEIPTESDTSYTFQAGHTVNRPVSKSKVEEILANPATSQNGGVYYNSERGDRLIDLASFRDKLWQMCNFRNPQLSSISSEGELVELRELIQQLLRWGWKYNKNLEEQAAQLHMLTGWSQMVEVSISRRMPILENHSQILFELLDASLSASASPDCSLRMAIILTQVALTCMAKLRDERFFCPGGVNSDNVTCLDIISTKQLSNGACNSILFKLIMAILRHDSSEMLRRRYFQYCRSILDPDVPATVLQYLLHEEQDDEDDQDLLKIDKEQAELAHTNFSILRKEAQAILDVVVCVSDQTMGLDWDWEPKSGLNQATILFQRQTRLPPLYNCPIVVHVGSLWPNCFRLRDFWSPSKLCRLACSVTKDAIKGSEGDGWHSLDSAQQLYTLEAELALLLRISHCYGKLGAQVLFSMGALEHLASCRMLGLQIKGSFRRADVKVGRNATAEIDRQQMINPPILRLVSCLTSLVETSDFLEVRNKIVREVIDFVKGHQSLFDQILRVDVSGADESTLEQINLVVAILSKVWPYEENDDYGFVQGLFIMMRALFPLDREMFNLTQSLDKQKKSELTLFQLCFSLSCYLYFLVTKRSLRFQVRDDPDDYKASGGHPPTLTLLVSLLGGVAVALENAAEEKSLLLNKIQDINELSRQEVDEIIAMCMRQDCVSPSDNIRKSHMVPESSAANKYAIRGVNTDSVEDIPSLCGKLFSTLERLELLGEDKTGHKLKVFHRLVSTLKEMAIRELTP
ncbi:hypothetical protein ACLOJK_040359 [Asimina triloba]